VAVNESAPMVFQITSLVESDVLPGDLQNEVTVFSDTIDDDPTNDSATGTVTVTTLADVGVTKVDLKEPVGPTEGFLYELEVTNYGPSVALNVVATDLLDENVTFSSASEDCVHNGTNPGGVVTCTADSLEVGETVDYLIAVTVNDVNVESVNNLYNQVSVDADTPEDPGDLENNSDDENTEVETPLGPVADLEIGKTGDPASVIAGELVTYTLTVTNTGPSVATNVRVLELIPYGTTAVSLEAENLDVDVTDEHCSLGGTCYLGKMEVDATAMVEVVLRVNADYEGDEIRNTASVSGDQADTTPANNIAEATTGVDQEAVLVIEKVDLMDPVRAGEVILYQIEVTNTGSSDAQDVVVTDTEPVGTDYMNASPGCLLAGDPVTTVTCSLGTIAAGASKSVWVEVRTDEGLEDPTTINNTAGVTSPTDEDALPDNPKEDTEDTLVNQPDLGWVDLEIAKSDNPDFVLAGNELTYTLTVTNTGPADAVSVVVVDALPEGVEFVSATTAYPLATCNAGVTCALGDMADGAVATITVVVRVNSDQVDDLLNYARVQASNKDTDPSNNWAEEDTEVREEADLSVSKVGTPEPVVAGETLNYTIVVSNTGPSDALDVIVTDDFPAELTDISAEPSQGTCSSLDPLSCNLGAIAAGEEATITIEATVVSGATGSIVNTVDVSSSTTDPDGDGPTATETTDVEPSADLELNKDATDTVNAGGVITYDLTVYNHGPSDAAGVVVTDTLHPQVSFISGTDCIESTSGEVTCTVASIAAGGSYSWTFTVLADADIDPGSSLENVAEVDSETADSNPFNNTDNACLLYTSPSPRDRTRSRMPSSA